MTRSQLNHRERVALALDRQPTDRVPIAMVCSGINPPAYADLSAYLAEQRSTTVERYLAPLIDVLSIAPRYRGPRLDAGEDIWSVVREPTSYGRGSYDEIVHYPLATAADVADLDRHRWPQPDWFDMDSLADVVAGANSDEPHCLLFSGGNIFETSWYMRGFEQAFVDMMTAPDLFHGIMRRVTDYYIAYCRRVLAAADGAIDMVFTADDVGGQNGLLMSLPMWREFIQPYHIELNRAIHEFGVRVIYHTDGAVMKAVPGLVEMGIDVLQALQFDAQDMDPATLKSEYGSRIGFEGGVSVQKTLPFGSPDDVREETLARIRVLGEGGGYILGPSHAIQAGTPPENIVAMFDTAAGAAAAASV